MPTACPRCRHTNPDDANFCEQCRTPLRRGRFQQEDAVDRLARRVAEENDRMARGRQQEWMQATPVFPKPFIWLGILLFVIFVVGFTIAMNMSPYHH